MVGLGRICNSSSVGKCLSVRSCMHWCGRAWSVNSFCLRMRARLSLARASSPLPTEVAPNLCRAQQHFHVPGSGFGQHAPGSRDVDRGVVRAVSAGGPSLSPVPTCPTNVCTEMVFAQAQPDGPSDGIGDYGHRPRRIAAFGRECEGHRCYSPG